jgi:hypothetical protein
MQTTSVSEDKEPEALPCSRLGTVHAEDTTPQQDLSSSKCRQDRTAVSTQRLASFCLDASVRTHLPFLAF